MQQSPYAPSRSYRRPRGGTAYFDQNGRRLPEVNQDEQPMETADTGLRTGSLRASGSNTGGGSAFDRFFGSRAATPPMKQVTSTGPASPALAATGAALMGVAPGVGAAMVANGTKPATHTTNVPDTSAGAFGRMRRTPTGGMEQYQESQTQGGRWVGTTSAKPVVPPGTVSGRVTNPGTSQFNTEGQRLTETVGSAGAPSIEYDPRHDTGIAKVANTAPNAARTVAIDSRYVAPGQASTGFITNGAITQNGGAFARTAPPMPATAPNLPAGVTPSAQLRHDDGGIVAPPAEPITQPVPAAPVVPAPVAPIPAQTTTAAPVAQPAAPSAAAAPVDLNDPEARERQRQRNIADLQATPMHGFKPAYDWLSKQALGAFGR